MNGKVTCLVSGRPLHQHYGKTNRPQWKLIPLGPGQHFASPVACGPSNSGGNAWTRLINLQNRLGLPITLDALADDYVEKSPHCKPIISLARRPRQAAIRTIVRYGSLTDDLRPPAPLPLWGSFVVRNCQTSSVRIRFLLVRFPSWYLCRVFMSPPLGWRESIHPGGVGMQRRVLPEIGSSRDLAIFGCTAQMPRARTALLPVFMSNRNSSYSCVNESRGRSDYPAISQGSLCISKSFRRRSSERLFVSHPDRLPEILMKSRHGLFIFRL